MLSKILDVLILPKEISAFERDYLARVNRVTMRFFVVHVPVFVLVAWFNQTGPLTALLLTSLVAVGPVLAYRLLANPRAVGLVYGFAAMLMGGLLVHFGQGPVQIEMHFYFFALIAMLALYGNPMAIVVAAVTVALHHLLLWLILPSSVFNYAAPWWVVAVHAAFVVLESAATVYIARSFFDNVIGLERVVAQRTRELDERNRAMRLVLDNVDQGLLTLDAQGRVLPEFSQAVERWFGAPAAAEPLWQFLSSINPQFAADFELAWGQCVEQNLPLELCIEQAPAALSYRGRHFRFGYRPLLEADGSLGGMLLVIGDVTSDVERQRLEIEQTETVEILNRFMADRNGFLEFLHECEELIAAVAHTPLGRQSIVKRALHTLKGNCMVFGVQTLAEVCHRLESAMAGEERLPTPAEIAELKHAWQRLEQRLGFLLGDDEQRRIELEPEQFDELLEAALSRRDHSEIAQRIAELKLETTAARLARVAAQARRIAKRLNKEGIDVQIEDSMLRLDPKGWSSFWSAFVHVVRNAVDHGLELPDARRVGGKEGSGRIRLRTYLDVHSFVIEISDDGAGIPWDSVRERARELGLRHATREDLVQALFAEGLSTASEINEYSGRGVGLSVVRSACVERGGRIEVHSEPQQGTTFVFRFPREVIAVDPAALLHRVGLHPASHVA
jgi:two-component system chemotaxis sensor kinase CheA